MDHILIEGARQGNLKNITVAIPKNKLTVLTGVSGSGKSTLAIDLLYNECQRQYLEAMAYQGIRKPEVDRVRGACPAIQIGQAGANRSPRSTMGTVTGITTGLRMIFEKLCQRACPLCGALIRADQCREETEKRNGEFRVYQYCSSCGGRLDKLTRSHFSFNTREGACPVCQGLGRLHRVDEAAVLREDLPLEQGAVAFWRHRYGEYQIGLYRAALEYYGLPQPDRDLPLGRFSAAQRGLLLHGTGGEEARRLFPDKEPPRTAAQGRFEGVFATLWRRLSEKGGDPLALGDYFVYGPCPACKGERLAPESRAAQVAGVRLPQLAALPLDGLRRWLAGLREGLPRDSLLLAGDYLADADTKLRRLCRVGLGYLTPDRQTSTLSGGEAQRLRLAAALDAEISGVLYLLDEPTVGLHPADTAGLVALLRELRDLGNTVVVIEHDPEVMRAADWLIDLGPGAGRHGGEVVGQGSWDSLLRQPGSVTGAWLARAGAPCPRRTPRPGDGGSILLRGVTLHNLKEVSLRLPTGCLTAVTGVSGSGKSTLVFDVLARAAQGLPHAGEVEGLPGPGGTVLAEQAAIARQRRSGVATYTGLYDGIRALFAASPAARAAGLTARDFSFNVRGGRCERCEGLGTVTSNLLFFEDVQVTCPACGGSRFERRVLDARWQGLSIADVLALSVEEALAVFAGQPRLRRGLELLDEAGLSYLELGRPLPTLSGGEAQRLGLARELIASRGAGALYLLDEPTAGLHPLDVERFLKLLHRLVDAGGTVIVVEHDRQLIREADWVVDLGPGGGEDGGRVIFEGPPAALAACPASVTGRFLAAACPG
ncbi:excinuclease ABC subunit UvrA [Anaerofilum sp. BX8]|uniref:UvrABC system protein A n=1 Tax=Anaerofilum hominis TaxID=2763016 RepID=A0A923IFD4_9FIRM|nr:excinuclease ABC subunit UvrA [Anaerofilum hominis]MBC5581822.1 excinuclease ABC subunit UvrA [Anaerofilum hominis]